jgi:hypothetical protein
MTKKERKKKKRNFQSWSLMSPLAQPAPGMGTEMAC